MPAQEKDYDHLYKVYLIGEINCGRTELFSNLFGMENTVAAIADYQLKSLTLDEQRLKIQVWNLRGGERSNHLTISKRHYSSMMGIFLVYNIYIRETFEKMATWLNHIRQECEPDAVIILVGNISTLNGHLAASRTVTTEEGKQFADQNGLLFTETLDQETIDPLFMEMIEKVHSVWKDKKPEIPKKKINLDESPSESTGKCLI